MVLSLWNRKENQLEHDLSIASRCRLTINRNLAQNAPLARGFLSANACLFILGFDDPATTVFVGKGKRCLSALGA